MGSSILHFDKPGLQTIVQDGGRFGFQAFGVPVGGFMDRSSAQIANWLVGNEPGSPVLEITLSGPEIEIEGNCQLAITGANISPSLNGVTINMYETIEVNNGSHLKFGPIRGGCRAYLSIGGKWKVKRWLDSSSAFLMSEKSLTPDSTPTKGSTLSVDTYKRVLKRNFPFELRPQFSNIIKISLLHGPEFEQFSKESINDFIRCGHKITIDSNRMGYRLDTQLKGFYSKREVISSGIVKGTIQITNSGQPIILMADAQTTGGYPRIGNVITAHMDRLAQAKPGDEIWFSFINLRDAYQALRDQVGTLKLVLGKT